MNGTAIRELSFDFTTVLYCPPYLIEQLPSIYGARNLKIETIKGINLVACIADEQH
jgi:hypothetical protein